GRAILARRPEGARVGRLDGPVEIGVGHHDQRVVAAELELHALAQRRRLLADLTADRDRPRERDRLYLRVLHQRGTDLGAAADDDVEDTGGNTRLLEAGGEVEAGERRFLRELHHHRVAVDQRRAGLPGGDRGGKVPGGDQADDAERAADGVDGAAGRGLLEQLALRPPGLAREVAEDRGAAGRFHPRLAQRLAHLERHVLRDL